MTANNEKARPAFIIGCPRSGTTWLQLLLAQHPAIASSQETHLFSRYIARLFDGWNYEKETNQTTGLCSILSEKDFYQICRDMSDNILERIHSEKPYATVILEKTPDQVFCIDLILRLYPNAIIINVIRDPRAVVASLLAASKSWGRSWAPANPIDAAKLWGKSVREGKASSQRTDKYIEVHYESLAQNTQAVLKTLVEWLDLPTDPDFYEQAVNTCSRNSFDSVKDQSKIPSNLRAELGNAKRKGHVASWRSELTTSQINIVEYLVLDLMKECGYKPLLNSRGRRPLRVTLHTALKSFSRSVAWNLERLTKKI